MFRIVSSDVYLSTFASNRSHMLNADGSWLQPPPTYPCISTAGTVITYMHTQSSSAHRWPN